ncbi:MAG: hypothetical protein ACE5JG_06505 [Planctomycetota bacterium]
MDVWAAIAPTASFGVRGLAALQKTRTGFYVYHSDDDPRTKVEWVRPRMKELPGSKADFVYTELPGRQHSLPMEVVHDFFEFFDLRRRTVAPGYRPTVRPQSSFLRKVSRDEKKYLPPLAAVEAEVDAGLKRLLKDLRTGGGVAQRAVPALVRHPDPKIAGRVAKVMLHKSSTPDVRMYAARVLGGRKAKGSIKALGRALRLETEKQALLAVLDALDAVEDEAAVPHVTRFLRVRVDYFRNRCMGSRIHHSDWVAIAPTLARACDVLRRYEAKSSAPLVARTVLEGIYLSGVEVLFDKAVQNPLPAARALMASCCKALQAFGDASVVPTLQAVSQGGAWLEDPAVANHLQETLRVLRPGP